MKLKLDLHVHTSRSTDAFTPPEQLRTICTERGLDGLAITDHNVLAQDLDDELVILPGIEISSRDGHIIGLGLSDAIPRGLSADETIRKIREQNGASIIPHPYDLFRSSVRPHLLTVRPDAIEVINSSIKYANSEATVRGHAPMLGEHNADVLRGVLGYGDDRIATLQAQGVLQSAKR